MQLDSKSETPFFLIWAIGQKCAIKESFDFGHVSEPDLLALERTLRPLRCLSEATAENRRSGDLCILQTRNGSCKDLEDIKGFSASEILEGFGGEEYVHSQCDECQANVYRLNPLEERSLHVAGCYGYLQSRYDDFRLFEYWQTIANHEMYELWQTEKLDTGRSLSREQVEYWLILLNSDTEFQHPDTVSFRQALEGVKQFGWKIQIHVVPESLIVDRNWIVPQHCSNCFATLEKWIGYCPSCRTKGSPVSLRKRLLRGDRPYWPLVRFLGVEGTAQFAEHYFDHLKMDD